METPLATSVFVWKKETVVLSYAPTMAVVPKAIVVPTLVFRKLVSQTQVSVRLFAVATTATVVLVSSVVVVLANPNLSIAIPKPVPLVPPILSVVAIASA